MAFIRERIGGIVDDTDADDSRAKPRLPVYQPLAVSDAERDGIDRKQVSRESDFRDTEIKPAQISIFW